MILSIGNHSQVVGHIGNPMPLTVEKDGSKIVGVVQIQYFADLHGWLLPPPDERSRQFWDGWESFNSKPIDSKKPRQFGLAGLIPLIRANRAEFKAKFKKVPNRMDLLFLGGDIFARKSPYCAIDEGKTLLAYLQKLGVHVFLLGNHEIEDFGLRRLCHSMRHIGPRCSVLGANVNIGKRAFLVKKYTAFKIDKEDIIIAGVTVGRLLAGNQITCRQEKLHLKLHNPNEKLSDALGDARKSKASSIILVLTHCDEAPGTGPGSAGELAIRYKASAVFSGHHHEPGNSDLSKPPYVFCTLENGQRLARMQIQLKANGKMDLCDAQYHDCEAPVVDDEDLQHLTRKLNEPCRKRLMQIAEVTEVSMLIAEAIHKCPGHESDITAIAATTARERLYKGRPCRGHIMQAVPNNDRILQIKMRGSELIGLKRKFQLRPGEARSGRMIFYPDFAEDDIKAGNTYKIATTKFTWKTVLAGKASPLAVCRLYHCIFKMFLPASGKLGPEEARNFERCVPEE